jgi:hypothetical protein
MRDLNIDNSRSYATEENLNKGTAKVDGILKNAEDSNNITALSGVRRLVVRNREGRYTAAYILRGDATGYASCVALHGFLVIG